MFTSGKLSNAFLAALFAGFLALSLGAFAIAHGDVNPPIFLTRIGGIISTYPRTSKFSVGTTTAASGKLSVYAENGETNTRIFNVASTSPSATGSVFSVCRDGSVYTYSTSTATPVKLIFTTAGATSTFNGTVYWSYGTCR